MATELKKIKLTSVDLVRAGANQAAEIDLFKSAGRSPEVQDKLREYNEALYRSFRSVQDDDGLTSEEKKALLDKSLAEYRTAVAELFAPEEQPVSVAPGFTPGDRYDMIQEVRKFNPFHDRLGRFANKNSFSTYSANPKMRVAQPSIIRSAQAGHGHTMNVHRESKGENINQNYDWMQGLPYGKPVAPPAPPKPPASKPATPKPKTPPGASTKPTANRGIDDAVKNVQLSDGQKLALQARDKKGSGSLSRSLWLMPLGKRWPLTPSKRYDPACIPSGDVV